MPKINFHPFPVLETDRLILRQLKASDSKALQALRSDSEVNKYLGRAQPVTLEAMDDFIQARAKDLTENTNIVWAITVKGSDEMIGSICIWHISADGQSGELGYELSPACQKRGYKGEALARVIVYSQKDLGLSQLIAYTREDHRSSRKLLQRQGFVLQKYVLGVGEEKCQAVYGMGW